MVFPAGLIPMCNTHMLLRLILKLAQKLSKKSLFAVMCGNSLGVVDHRPRLARVSATARCVRSPGFHNGSCWALFALPFGRCCAAVRTQLRQVIDQLSLVALAPALACQ